MGASSAAGDERSAGLERLVYFSDAVFAIVITLLVLPIAAEAELPDADGGLARQVWALWPRVLSFVISFLVIGQFWIVHHRMFELVRRYDQRLLWLNLLVLLTVTFMPFPTALLGAHGDAGDRFPAVFYAASMTVTSASLTGTLIYVLRAGLVHEGLDRRVARYLTRRAVLTTAVVLASVGVAYLLGLGGAIVCWLVLLPAARVLLARRHRRSVPAPAGQSRATRSR
jgi:uncharacterized membrane protein